jgi:hypothetical protein
MHPSKSGTASWTSAHWNNGIERTVRYDQDPYDPTGWTEDHSSGTDGFRIDGKGIMTMSGDGPRFHVNSLDSSKGARQFFRDAEYTAYYRRKGDAGKNWGGMVAGLRSGPLGHASQGGNDCDATTYYARFRNDGKWDFEKELKHPGSSVWSGSGLGTQDPLWNGSPLPLDRWIGMKFVVYNTDNNAKVKLELYIDSTSFDSVLNGTPENGGTWQLVGTVVDSGSWPSGDVSGCAYQQNSIILEGNGTLLMRTDGDTAEYAMVSVREIVPTPSAVRYKAQPHLTTNRNVVPVQCIFIDDHPVNAGAFSGRRRMVTLQGRLCANGGKIDLSSDRRKRPGVFIVYREQER